MEQGGSLSLSGRFLDAQGINLSQFRFSLALAHRFPGNVQTATDAGIKASVALNLAEFMQ